ncbi:MAG TPA: four helix bundle protein [Burkholderiaceae bacterium]|nr:four helix bundle protein [Burkholderiaceae bacterium]
MRDHTKLRVFHMADALVMDVYAASRRFPSDERFGLTSQIRRCGASIAANIVEGCARATEQEYLRFIEIAYGSARELQYELDLCARLGYLDQTTAAQLGQQCTDTAKSLNALLRSLRRGR